MAMALPPPGTVCCILCRGMVTYRNLDVGRFASHMQFEHGAYFDMDFLLAACLMDEEERKAVRNVMELKHKQQQEKGKEVERLRERGRAVEESRGEKRRAPSPAAPPHLPPPQPVPVKEETPEEVQPAPEQAAPSPRPSFPCAMCDKSFLLQKYLTSHQAKTGHSNTSSSSSSSSSSPPPSTPTPPVVLECTQCSYTGGRPQDLRLHITRKHGEAKARPATPSTPSTPAPPSTATPSATPDTLFSSLSTSWSQPKEPKEAKEAKEAKEVAKVVKEEPANLQEVVVGPAVSTGEGEGEAADDPAPVGEEATLVEATTFVAIQTEAAATPQAVEQVDTSKSKYFKANPQTLDKVDGKMREQYDVSDPKLPDGWKVKEIVHEFKSGRKETKKHFLTPDFKALKTGLAVLEYMRLSGKYSAKEIMDYAKYLAVPVNRLEKYMELYL